MPSTTPLVGLLDMAAKERARVCEVAKLAVSETVQAPLLSTSAPYAFYDTEIGAFMVVVTWQDYGEDEMNTGSATVTVPSPLYGHIFSATTVPERFYRQMTLDAAIAMSTADSVRIDL